MNSAFYEIINENNLFFILLNLNNELPANFDNIGNVIIANNIDDNTINAVFTPFE